MGRFGVGRPVSEIGQIVEHKFAHHWIVFHDQNGLRSAYSHNFFVGIVGLGDHSFSPWQV